MPLYSYPRPSSYHRSHSFLVIFSRSEIHGNWEDKIFIFEFLIAREPFVNSRTDSEG